jgi:hypothetical protein
VSSPKSARNGIVAGFVTVAGVVTIWALGAVHQEDQTEALSRQWADEQWDVARTCLLGTPVGRGQPEETIAALLETKLVDTLASVSTSAEAPDRATTWPTRCVPLFPSLRVDRSILRADPGDALAELEVLVPRILPADGGDVSTSRARELVRELAAPIARLDAAMPSGAEYDVARFERPDLGVDPAVALDSLDCPPPDRPRRPFLDARIGDEDLFDELELAGRSMRLTGSLAGAFQLAKASEGGTETRPLARDDAQHPLFWDEDTILWVLSDGARVALRGLDAIEDEASVTLDEGAAFDRVSLCRADGVAHLVTKRGAELAWARWAGPGEEPTRLVPLRARMPESGVSVACDDDRLALVWQDDEEWTGTLCAADACEPIPRFFARGDLQIAISGDLLAVGRGRRSDLPLARVLTREPQLQWSEPVVAARGRLEVTEGAFGLAVCNPGETGSTLVESPDGRRWETR